ncbi:MAG: hypothetical protein JWN04_3984 [Myxococcaceae bacterium]|nr:hypothetical protein [Myxococcaceae bacterium]
MPGVSGIPAPLPMPGSAQPGIPRGEVPAPFAPAPRPSMPSGRLPTQTGRSIQPTNDPFAVPPGGASFPPPPGSGGGFASPSGAPVARSSVPADPFAAAPAPTQAAREVRLVFDDKAVSDDEIGRKSGAKFIIAALVAAAVGILVGWFVGSTWRERQLYDLVLQDAKDVYNAVGAAAPKVEEAQKLIDQAAKSASPGAGKTIDIDFKALDSLRKLEKPFPADVFSRKHYRALEATTVDLLFQYYNNTNLLWSKLQVLTAKTATPASKESLTRAAKAAGELATTDYGCIPFKADKDFGCGIMAVTKGEEGKVTVNTRQGALEKTAFSGQDLTSKTSDYVIIIDKARSGDILSGATNQFQKFAGDLMEAKLLADQTAEMQGKLTQALGNVVKLQALN